MNGRPHKNKRLIPQYGEMVPGRLKAKLSSLSQEILMGVPVLNHSIHVGFLTNRKQGIVFRWQGLRWWRRLEDTLEQTVFIC